jgi:hypothetical protein
MATTSLAIRPTKRSSGWLTATADLNRYAGKMKQYFAPLKALARPKRV